MYAWLPAKPRRGEALEDRGRAAPAEPEFDAGAGNRSPARVQCRHESGPRGGDVASASRGRARTEPELDADRRANETPHRGSATYGAVTRLCRAAEAYAAASASWRLSRPREAGDGRQSDRPRRPRHVRGRGRGCRPELDRQGAARARSQGYPSAEHNDRRPREQHHACMPVLLAACAQGYPAACILLPHGFSKTPHCGCVLL